MIELHSHSLLSDGELTPSELVMLAKSQGYKGIVVTDHVDQVNIYDVCKALSEGLKRLSLFSPIPVSWGVEITHVPPKAIGELVREARSLGARLVIGHGETITEPVHPGTNAAFVEAGVDILAHPGLIDDETAKEAASRGIYLEVTTRKGHAYTNGHVFRSGKRAGARFVVCNDTHTYGDMLPEHFVEKVLLGSGMSKEEARLCFKNLELVFGEVLKKG